MKLVKLRLRGLGVIPETDWWEVSSGLNLFYAPTEALREGLITALETINPPYRCREAKPFAGEPTVIEKNGYTRHIAPGKRTMAIGIFNCTPQLVTRLARIDPVFYETELIEVGRRLDYSRWLNFIELASSTRWSAIARQINTILATPAYRNDMTDTIRRRIAPLASTDRIKGELMRELAAWLEAVALHTAPVDQAVPAELLSAVNRAEHFARARTVVENRLPLFATINLRRMPSYRFLDIFPSPSAALPRSLHLLLSDLHDRLQGYGDNASDRDGKALLAALQSKLDHYDQKPRVMVRLLNNKLTYGTSTARGAWHSFDDLDPTSRLEAFCRLIVTLGEVLRGSQPILLFSVPHRQVADIGLNRLLQLLDRLAARTQCLCAHSSNQLFPGSRSIPVQPY